MLYDGLGSLGFIHYTSLLSSFALFSMMTRFSFYIPSLFVCSLTYRIHPLCASCFIFFPPSYYQYFNDDGLVFSAASFFPHSFNFSSCLYLFSFRIVSALLPLNVFYEQWSSLGGSFGRFFLGGSIWAVLSVLLSFCSATLVILICSAFPRFIRTECDQ